MNSIIGFIKVILAIAASAGVAKLLWKPFFGDMETFQDCIRFWLTPDFFSMMRGEYGQDWFAEMRLGLWIGLSVAAGAAIFIVL